MESTPAPAVNPYATVIRSEGQRLLLDIPGTLLAIARQLGSNAPQTVLNWREGTTRPGERMRAQLYAVFGIPPDAWTRKPTGGVRPVGQVTPGAAGAPGGPPPSTLDDVLLLLDLARFDVAQPNLVAAERSRLLLATSRLLAQREQLERAAELAEDRYVREHPAWHRLRAAIVRALVPYPAAAKAVLDALAELGA